MDWTEISRQVDLEYTCSHDLSEMRGRRDSLGREHVVKQCLTCGANLGAQPRTVLAGKPWGSLMLFDEDAQRRYHQHIQDEKHRRWNEGQQERQEDYQAYLETPRWKALRQRVLDRDHGLCQGCLEKRATEVHHLTYARRGAEMAFDLVSLCRPCHEALSVAQEQTG